MRVALRKIATFAVVFVIAAALLAHPKRDDTWTCPTCGDENEAGRAKCMNGCGAEGPLAPRRGGGSR